MMRTDPVPGALVLITGAARGMGALYARRAIAGGARALALWDIDQAALDELVAELSASDADVRGYRVDISQLAQIRDASERVREELGTPDILVNNAGIVHGGPFWEHDDERDTERTMRINALAPMWITSVFLTEMMTDAGRQRGILNIASAAGTLANPNMSVYAASKWALIGWSESVRLELAAAGIRHLTVTTFCPSYISTGMFAGARGPLLTPIMTPRAATKAAWNGMRRGTPLVLRPWTVKLSMALRGLLPTRVWDLMADRVFRVYSSMDEFTGRPPAS